MNSASSLENSTPECGNGACAFPDIKLMSDDGSIGADAHHYFESCLKVNLHWQVGSRYFVSASNAAQIVFLAEAAAEFEVHKKRNWLK